MKDPETGLVTNQAYTILRTKTIGKIRFVQLRNPWTTGDWAGDWANQSPKWHEHSEIEKTMVEDPEVRDYEEI